ncbi:hypothetical protein SAMN02799622_00911 [Methylobacterium sp. UNC378MF]|uniref:hypothetical protein n=1 Tax=Methylobacterium sp. UNC378MF TaxID=1502748 RepID=UPI0008820D36|nr:hypothetical protein [Methylobacterium sp. UNC378MF]SDA13108.1 hypothetical protein SAMN02799622_00911 [Methylobacterium sp. UNC378MF]
MVAYSFKKWFGPPILAGTKAQTIRAERKRHARPGELVQLYTGMRTRQCRRLGETPCLSVNPIRIELPRARRVPEVLIFDAEGALAEHWLTARALQNFARADGFADFDELHAFWRAEHPGVDTFHGVLIRWQPLVAADALDIAGVAA